jgi:hypothetical protein
MLYFVVSVLNRYFATKMPHFLFWGIGLAMFGAGSFAEAFLALAWNKWVFFSWYLFGAALNAAWIGHGTLYLMVRRNWRHAITLVLLIGSFFATFLMFQAVQVLDTEVFTTELAISEQYGTKIIEVGEPIPADARTILVTDREGNPATAVRGLLPYGTPVRLTTPFFNIYGLITLVGGALYSAFLFWRKRVLPNRVIGNVVIAAGALLIGFASTLTRIGYGQFLYLGELLSAVMMFIGFRIASRPQPQDIEITLPAEPAPGV